MSNQGINLEPYQEDNSPVWEASYLSGQTEFEEFSQKVNKKFSSKFNIKEDESEDIMYITLDSSVETDAMTFWEVDVLISLEAVNELHLEAYIEGSEVYSQIIDPDKFLSETTVDSLVILFKSFDLLYKIRK